MADARCLVCPNRPRSGNYAVPSSVLVPHSGRLMNFPASQLGTEPGTPAQLGAGACRACTRGAGAGPVVRDMGTTSDGLPALATPPPAPPPPPVLRDGVWTYPVQTSAGGWMYPPAYGPAATTSDALPQPPRTGEPVILGEMNLGVPIALAPPAEIGPPPALPELPVYDPGLQAFVTPGATPDVFAPTSTVPETPPADEEAPPPWYKSTAFLVGASAIGLLAVGGGLWYATARKRRRGRRRRRR